MKQTLGFIVKLEKAHSLFFFFFKLQTCALDSVGSRL